MAEGKRHSVVDNGDKFGAHQFGDSDSAHNFETHSHLPDEPTFLQRPSRPSGLLMLPNQ